MQFNLLTKCHGSVQLCDNEIFCHAAILPGESNPHGLKPFVVGHEFGPVCLVWAECTQEALDEMVDVGAGGCFLAPEADHGGDGPGEDDSTEDSDAGHIEYLGNHGVRCNTNMLWTDVVRFDPSLDRDLVSMVASARDNGAKTLAEYLKQKEAK